MVPGPAAPYTGARPGPASPGRGPRRWSPRPGARGHRERSYGPAAAQALLRTPTTDARRRQRPQPRRRRGPL
jgi:hypothetical protein